jgi:hypothetical protein
VSRSRRVLRPVALLLGLCLVAGVVVAGMVFPAAAGLVVGRWLRAQPYPRLAACSACTSVGRRFADAEVVA